MFMVYLCFVVLVYTVASCDGTRPENVESVMCHLKSDFSYHAVEGITVTIVAINMVAESILARETEMWMLGVASLNFEQPFVLSHNSPEKI